MQSYKHHSTRPLIPSKEEAGMEAANEKVTGYSKAGYPLNPVVTRGQDPELFWMHKYGPEDEQDTREVDIRSLYRVEHISPELLINKLYRSLQDSPKTGDQLGLFAPDARDLFGNTLDLDEFEKVGEYYKHQGDWANRLIQGDSLLAMTSLLEREGFAGKVQTIYFDPPYGIKYGSNWQIKLNERDVKDGSDDHLSSEPEQIKAFRDTWELGIHSYLSYLRDRLLVARELLTESGSCFVQISDENVHLVRCLMDEVFGSGNFNGMIAVTKTAGGLTTVSRIPSRLDYIVWYAKNVDNIKYRQLYEQRPDDIDAGFNQVLLSDGSIRGITSEERDNVSMLPFGAKLFRSDSLTKPGPGSKYDIAINGKVFNSGNRWWGSPKESILKLVKMGRVRQFGNTLRYLKFIDDFPYKPLNNLWSGLAGAKDIVYVVQTNDEIIKRCLLMTTDPGDLVLDPTCGSGTTAYVAEQWGRRWITLDTSRIALNIAKTRLMTAVYPYYYLYSDVEVETSEKNGKIVKKITPRAPGSQSRGDSESPRDYARTSDLRQGFVYEEVPHITLKSLANDEPPATETLYDRPYTDKDRLRVAGPFTVETLQADEPVLPRTDEAPPESSEAFELRIFEHLKAAGIMNGAKNERAVFTRVERLAHPHLHAEGFYQSAEGERKAYVFIGPQFGTVSRQSVNEAVKECRLRGDADWLIILGFSFESDISNQSVTTSLGGFEATKVRMHDDLLQEGLTKKDKKAASFVTIGEPDIVVTSDEWLVNSSEQILCNYGILKKLSGLDSLAKINALGERDLRAYCLLSKRRDVWVDFAVAQGQRFDTREYCRRAGEKLNGGISSVFGDSERFFSGVGDFDYFISDLGLSDPGKLRDAVGAIRGNQQNADRLAEIPSLTPLATRHYALVTIQGLDIYDPIRDEVRARSVADIAYWMLDDDYDGSNFIVRQVFFCGGDKNEFDKWRKGISGVAARVAKMNAERRLRIELDDDAWERLYGFRSHPIPAVKGRRVAVRVVSQFGEESMKVVVVSG
jgi:adenine-specific DNA-methyltransferase